jgi:hypothetical protein
MGSFSLCVEFSEHQRILYPRDELQVEREFIERMRPDQNPYEGRRVRLFVAPGMGAGGTVWIRSDGTHLRAWTKSGA